MEIDILKSGEGSCHEKDYVNAQIAISSYVERVFLGKLDNVEEWIEPVFALLEPYRASQDARKK